MPLPDHIRRQVEAGQAAFEAQQKGEPIPGLDVPIEDASLSNLEASPAAEEPNLDPQVKVDPDPPQEAPEAEQTPIGDPPPEDDDELARARHAMLSWKGRAQAAKNDMAKLTKQIEQLTETTTAQFNAIAKLQTQLAEVPPTSAVTPAVETAPKSLITAEEREQYGEEFSNYIERLADMKAEQRMKQFAAQVDNQLKSVTGQVEQFGKRTQQQIAQEFYRDLDRLVPQWRDLNEDQDFNHWLTERDVYSGDMRKNLLDSACGLADSERAARFFTGFLAEQAALNPGTTASTPGNGIAGRKVLEDMAAPGRPRQPASREAPAPEKISEAEARTFFTNVTKGKWRNDPKGKADAIRRIEAALLRGDFTLQ
jgi:hypothetical protein